MISSYIVNAVRTPIGNFGGMLSSIRADDLAAHVIKALLQKNAGLDPALIEDVILGCANQAGEDNRNVSRMALLLAGMPYSVPGETVNRLCASGMAAVINVSRNIETGNGDLFIAGGVENMTRGPWVISKASEAYGRDSKMFDSSFGWRFINAKLHQLYGTEAMGETAENLAELYKISREDQDKFSLWSQQKASKAKLNNRFEKEITPIEITGKKGDVILFSEDEFIKSNTSLEILAKLRPAFKKEGGTVTAGNSSGLNDGAVALLLASDNGLKENNLTPKARIVSAAVVGVEPRIMGIGPVKATEIALKRAGLNLSQIDVIEINEAFAAQVLSCTRALKIDDNDTRINPNGGGIALGHPLGVSGGRLLQTAAIELHESNKKYALCTMCIGVGQGYAAIIEKV
jgi:acetyl-CoA acyltransferase